MQSSPSQIGIRVRGALRPRSLVTTGAVLGACALLSACGSSSKSSSASTSASAPAATSSTSATAVPASASGQDASLTAAEAVPTSIGARTPLKTAPPSGKTFVYLGTTNPQNVEIAKAFGTLAKAAHWNYSVADYDPANPSSFSAAVSTAIAKHAQYVAEAGTIIPPAILSELEKANVKVAEDSAAPVTENSTVLNSSDGAAQDALMGRLVAQYVAGQPTSTPAKVVMEHVPAYPVLDAFTDTFTSTLKAACPKCSVTEADITLPQLVAGQVDSTVVSTIRRTPGTNWLIFDSGPFADGIQSALSSAGLTNIKIGGEAADAAGFAALRAGTQQVWTGFEAGYQAYVGMDAFFRNAEGMPIPADDDVMPTQLVTQQNVGSTTVWAEPANALSLFEQLWKLS